MIRISSNNVYALFDPGVTHSFILSSFVMINKKISPIPLKTNLCISISSRDVILVNLVYKDCISSR